MGAPLLLAGLILPLNLANQPNSNDFTVRVDTLITNPSDHADEKLLRSIEVVARPDVPFSGKVVLGSATLMLSGCLTRSDDDSKNWQIDVRHVFKVATGDRIPIADGKWEPVVDTSATETTIGIHVNEKVTLSRFETVNESSAGRVELKQRNVLLLSQTEKSLR